MTHPTEIVPTPTLLTGVQFRLAYEQCLPEMLALDEDELLPINIDVPAAVTRALGLLPRLMALRPEVVRALPEHDVRQLDKLEAYVLAMAHSQAMSMSQGESPAEDLAALSVEGGTLRESLLGDAANLARHGLIDKKRLEDIKGLVGYRNTAFDLLALAGLFRDRWAAVEGKTPTRLADIEHAETLARRTLAAVGEREQTPASIAEVSQLRQRIFSLFVRAYGETRRAVTYLRWNDDNLDTLCPSLYSGRRSKRSEKPEAEPVAPVAPAPAGPVAPVLAGTAPAVPAPVGLPGASPFSG